MTSLSWLGVSASAAKDVDQLFSIHHKTGLDRIDAALAALGRRLVVSVESA